MKPYLSLSLVAVLFAVAGGCNKQKTAPVEPLPGPMLSEDLVSRARSGLHDDLEVVSKALCKRKPVTRLVRPGDGTKELAALLADKKALDACSGSTKSTETKAAKQAPTMDKRGQTEDATDQKPKLPPCESIWRRLAILLSRQSVCSPFSMTRRSGDRPPQTRLATILVDSLLADVQQTGKRKPRRALVRLSLLMAMLEDFQRGPVPWATAVALTKLWPKVAEVFAALLSRNRKAPRILEKRITRLNAALPSIRSVLLGEHLHRMALAGLLPGRVDLSRRVFPALPAAPNSKVETVIQADHRNLALLLARHFYRRAVAGCRGRSLSICRAALKKVATDQDTDQFVDELKRHFLVRFQQAPAFRTLVMNATIGKGEKRLTEDEAAVRYWNKLLAWAKPWNTQTLPLLARPGFLLAAMGYHVKVSLFIAKHPTRAIYSQVAPFAFSFAEPYSGKPIRVAPDGHKIEVTAPARAVSLHLSPYIIELKRRRRH